MVSIDPLTHHRDLSLRDFDDDQLTIHILSFLCASWVPHSPPVASDAYPLERTIYHVRYEFLSPEKGNNLLSSEQMLLPDRHGPLWYLVVPGRDRELEGKLDEEKLENEHVPWRYRKRLDEFPACQGRLPVPPPPDDSWYRNLFFEQDDFMSG